MLSHEETLGTKWWNCQVGHVSGHYVENSIECLVEYSEKTKLQFEIEFEIGGIFVCFVAKSQLQ